MLYLRPENKEDRKNDQVIEMQVKLSTRTILSADFYLKLTHDLTSD